MPLTREDLAGVLAHLDARPASNHGPLAAEEDENGVVTIRNQSGYMIYRMALAAKEGRWRANLVGSPASRSYTNIDTYAYQCGVRVYHRTDSYTEKSLLPATGPLKGFLQQRLDEDLKLYLRDRARCKGIAAICRNLKGPLGARATALCIQDLRLMREALQDLQDLQKVLDLTRNWPDALPPDEGS